jgi:TPR repeat protein
MIINYNKDKDPEVRALCRQALKDAAGNGNARAALELGRIYFNDNPDSGILYFKRCAEVEEKGLSCTCAYDLGLIYYEGNPRYLDPKPNLVNMPLAKLWLEKALALGYYDNGFQSDPSTLLPIVRNALARQYTNGTDAYNAGNMMEAFRLWHAAAQGQKDIVAMNGLAYLMANGLGTAQDLYHGAEWYGFAGDAGDAAAYVRAGNTFCRVSNGEYVRAREMYQKAVAKGVPGAQELLVYATRMLDERVRGVMAEREAVRQEQSAAFKKWEAQDHTSYDTHAPASNVKWGTPDKTAAQQDAEMYDKMHREQDAREKHDKDKWGR